MIKSLPPKFERARPPTHASVAAFLFDVDGVITDTARLHAEAWRQLAHEKGLEFRPSDGDAVRGLSRDASLRLLLRGRRVAEDAFREMTERKNRYYLEQVRNLSSADMLPGFEALHAELAAQGVKCAAVSISRNARSVLESVGMADRLNAIIDGSDERLAADGCNRYLLAAADLGVEPRRCVVVEDSEAGVRSAKASDMMTIGLGDRRRLSHADLVFESLCGVRSRELLQWIGSGPLDGISS